MDGGEGVGGETRGRVKEEGKGREGRGRGLGLVRSSSLIDKISLKIQI